MVVKTDSESGSSTMADGVNTVEVYLDNILQVLHDMINNDNRWVKQVKQLSYAIAC